MNRYIVSESDGFMKEKEILRCICILQRCLTICKELNSIVQTYGNLLFVIEKLNKVIQALESEVDV